MALSDKGARPYRFFVVQHKERKESKTVTECRRGRVRQSPGKRWLVLCSTAPVAEYLKPWGLTCGIGHCASRSPWFN